MTRLVRILSIAGLSSVYLMQMPCAYTKGGLSIFPKAWVGGSFSDLFGQLTDLIPFV